MKIVEKVITILSQKEYRIGFLILGIILFISISFSLINIDLNQISNYKITDVKDIIELILILITLIVLYISTNKSEVSRYKNNWKFYADTYSKLELLNYITDDRRIITSSSIDYKTYIEKYKDNLQLKNIVFRLNDCEYSLPFLIEEQGREILMNKFNIQSYTDYNGLTLSLKKIYLENEKLIFEFCKAYYYQALLTNLIPEHEIINKLTVRDIIESPHTKTISLLEDSLAANHLGISILISVKVNNTNYFIIPKRSNKTAVFKGSLSPSISGASNIHSCRENKGNVSIQCFFKNEFDEEISNLVKKLTNNEDKEFLSLLLEKSILLGVTRELKRLGKPEIFFLFNSGIDVSTNFIHDQIGKDIIEIPEDKLSGNNENIDRSENESYLLIKAASIDKLINERFHKSMNKSSYKKEECNTLLGDYIISESLLVNIILYKNSLK